MDPGSLFSSDCIVGLEGRQGAYLFSMQTLCYNCRKGAHIICVQLNGYCQSISAHF